MAKVSNSHFYLNDDPAIVALERAMASSGEGLGPYKGAISELIREVRIARAKAKKVDALERKLTLAEKRIRELLDA